MNDHFFESTASASVTLVELLRSRAIHQATQWAYTFLEYGDGDSASITYGDLDRRVRAIAAHLQTRSAPGERALLLYPPGLDYVAAFFGCLYAGLVAVPAYPPHPARLERTFPRLRAITNDARPSLALTTAAILPMAEALFAQDMGALSPQWLATDSVTPEMAEAWTAPAISDHSLAFLQYTSGSTATPRGVMLTHRNLLHNLSLIHQSFRVSTASRGVIWLPPYHDMGLIGGILEPLYGGFPVTLMSPVAFLQSPIRWLEAISNARATISGGPNFAYELCVRKSTPEQRASLDLSSWDVAFNGAEPIHPGTLARFAEAFAPHGFRPQALYPCYGLAEATLIVSGSQTRAVPVVRSFRGAALEHHQVHEAASSQDDSRTLVGCGQSPPSQTIRIAHPVTLAESPLEEVGEVWVSGPSIAQGYWARPEETTRTFQAYLANSGEGPFLRTGDLGFFHDGELFVTGRIKDLIIIRGRNHYPQDIEQTVEACHPMLRPGSGAAFSIEVDGEERLVTVQEVDRHFRDTDVDDVARLIRQAVVDQHELQVYAVVLIGIGSIPKTSSGKIQRHACRADFLAGALKQVGISILEAPRQAPAGPGLTRQALLAAPDSARQALLQASLQDHIARVLGVTAAELDAGRPLNTLGIDSLLAVELQWGIESALRVTCPMTLFLQGITIEQLATELWPQLAAELAAQSAGAPDGPAEWPDASQPVPLSFEQERLWFFTQLYPGQPAFNLPFALRLVGPLDRPALSASLNGLLRRHASLRTALASLSGQPYQDIQPSMTWDLEPIDLRSLPASERQAQALQYAAQQVGQPLDLARAPLMRVTLLQMDDQEHLLLLTLHHAIADLWSLNILARDLAACYEARVSGQEAALPDLPVSYAGFAQWQRRFWLEQGPAIQAHQVYWRDCLAGAPPVLELPTDYARPETPEFQGAAFHFELPAALSQAVRQFSRDQGVTPYMTLLAAFYGLLQQYSGQHDLVVGSPVSGRLHPDLENIVGLFAYPIPLRADLSGNPALGDVLERVRAASLSAYPHQRLPFARIVEAVRPDRRSRNLPIFQVMFGLLDRVFEPRRAGPVEFSPMTVGKQGVDYDMLLTLVSTDQTLVGVWEYRTDLFTPDTIRLLAEAYRMILEQLIQRPETRLAELALPEALRARTQASQKHCLHLAATFTAEPIRHALEFWIGQLALSAEVVLAPYHQVFQQLLDPTSLFATNARGANIVLLRLEDWARHSAGGDAPFSLEPIEAEVDNLVNAVRVAAGRSRVPYLVCICPASPGLPAGLDKLEARLAALLGEIGGVYVIAPQDVASSYPVARLYDAYADREAHLPYTTAYYTALGTMVMRRFHALVAPPHKVIVLDCDQTLWKGVCGEDGPAGVDIDPPRRLLQQFVLAQQAAGKLVCLCSKNNEADVWAVFQTQQDMPLRREHLVAWRLNWQPKSSNLRDLAEALNLSLDSFIFLDDDALEIAEVQAGCPEVLALQLPDDPDRIPKFLAHVWAFDSLKVTEADRQRTEQYRQQAARDQLRKSASTLEDFLAGLELQIELDPLSARDVERVAQLTGRTNQFNLTTIRRTESELRALWQSGTLECLTVRVRDRFGDYGLVGAVLYAAREDALAVETFLLSCRVLGRRVEHAVLAQLKEIAWQRHLAYVTLDYRPTGKNQPALEFLNSLEGDMQFVAGEAQRLRVTARPLRLRADSPVTAPAA